MVYINDFKMPESCGECPMKRMWAYDDYLSCRIKQFVWHPSNAKDRHPKCPLKEAAVRKEAEG